MDKTWNVLWAKKAVEDGKEQWLPLPQHLWDTKFVASRLYRSYLSKNQRKIIRGAIQRNDTEGERITQFLASVHDIGKATPAFQSKESRQSASRLDNDIRLSLIQQKYFNQDSDSLPYPKQSPHALAGEVILRENGFRNDVGAIEGGHHGHPVDDLLIVKKQSHYEANYHLTDKDPIVQKRWENTQKGLIRECLRRSGYSNSDAVPRIRDVSAQVILEGIVIMADWIASNPYFFPLFDIDRTHPKDAMKRFKKGWRAWFRDYQWRPTPHRDVDKYYQHRFRFSPRPLQRKLFRTMNGTKDPGITIIESGMGSGKTEAALATVEQVAQKDGDSGMFFCLPTQGSTNAMFARVKTWADDIAEWSGKGLDMQLLHGKVAMNDEYNDLPRANNIGEDSHTTTLVNEWFSGNKTGILGNFVVGTIDQLLLLGLKQNHLALRHLGFSKKVVVIDEAHSFDDYMQEYLYRALEWLGKYHVPVIVLSATLPLMKRDGMISAYLDDPDYRTDPKNRDAYPLITYSDDEKVHQLTDFPSNEPQRIQVHRLATDDLPEKLRSLLRSGGIAGIIVNTVKRAQRLANLLERYYPADEITVLHSSFIATHRIAKENRLLQEIGKNGERYRRHGQAYPHIIIGTQVLEQSLDIDVDVMISDFAPMDDLVQRLGRLQRHRNNDELRPANLEHPHLYVLRTSEEFDFARADKFIYSDYLLMRTQYYLPDTITLPQDIAPLVQTVYDTQQLHLSRRDPGDMDLNGNLSKEYRKSRRRYVHQRNQKRKSAHENMLDDYDDQGEDLIGWLRDDVDDDAQGLAQVRDSSGSIEVIVVQRPPNEQGYGAFGTKQDISEDISRTAVAKQLAKETLRLPNALWQNNDSKDQDTMQATIQTLRKENRDILRGWQDQPFLRGQLGLVLDSHAQYHFNGFLLTYDKKLGLRYEKE